MRWSSEIGGPLSPTKYQWWQFVGSWSLKRNLKKSMEVECEGNLDLGCTGAGLRHLNVASECEQFSEFPYT